MNREPVTQAELDVLVATGHCVNIYPRKRQVSIDGFPRRPIVGPLTPRRPLQDHETRVEQTLTDLRTRWENECESLVLSDETPCAD